MSTAGSSSPGHKGSEVTPTSEQRLLLAIVLLLFAIQLTLVGGGTAGVLLGAIGLLVALSGVAGQRPRQ